MIAVTEFSHSWEQEPHRSRTRELLRNHPEMRRYIGANPYSFLIIMTAVALDQNASGVPGEAGKGAADTPNLPAGGAL